MHTFNQKEFERREARQIRAIKQYAKSLNLELEQAFINWIKNGHAKAWAENYDKEDSK